MNQSRYDFHVILSNFTCLRNLMLQGPDFWRRGRVISRKRKMQSKLHSIHCEYCLKNSFVDRELEDRWVQLCMTQLDADPRCRLPGSCEAFSEGNNEVEGHDKMTGGMDSDVVPSQTEKIMTDQVDLPALLLAAHLLQQSGDLLTYVPPPLTPFFYHCVAVQFEELGN